MKLWFRNPSRIIFSERRKKRGGEEARELAYSPVVNDFREKKKNNEHLEFFS